MSSLPAARAPKRVVLVAACALALSLPARAAAPPAAGAAPAASAVPACALAGAPRRDFAMRVPFEVVDGRIYVQARVNDRGPFRFAIDTGASGIGRADSRLVAALGLERAGRDTNSDGLASAEIDTTTLASLEVGGMVHEDVTVPTRDYNGASAATPLDGIVGRGFFADGLLVVDYPARRLSFSRTLALPRDRDGALPYERPFRVPVSIGSVRAEGNLDTGANVAFVLPRPLFDRIGGAAPESAGGGTLANSRVETQRSTVAGPFRIGNATLGDVEVRVSERYPELLVGAHALQRFVLLIDQRSKAVAVCPP